MVSARTGFEGNDVGTYDLVLIILLVVGVKTGKFHSASVGNLVTPFILVGYVVDIDGSAVVCQVEAAILLVEPADGSLEPEEVDLVRLVDECLPSSP